MSAVNFFHSSRLDRRLNALGLRASIFIKNEYFESLYRTFMLLRNRFVLPSDLVMLNRCVIMSAARMREVRLFISFPNFIRFNFSFFKVAKLSIVMNVTHACRGIRYEVEIANVRIFGLLRVSTCLIRIKNLGRNRSRFQGGLLFRSFTAQCFIGRFRDFFVEFSNKLLRINVRMNVPGNATKGDCASKKIRFFNFLVRPTNVISNRIRISS